LEGNKSTDINRTAEVLSPFMGSLRGTVGCLLHVTRACR